MRYKILKILKARRSARKKRAKEIRWMKYLVSCIIIGLLFLFSVGCENTRHSIGVTAKPFATGDKMEDSVKFNYKIIFGRIRKGEGSIDD
jgi:hypothetical protein